MADAEKIVGTLQKVKAPCLRCGVEVTGFLIPDGRFICPTCDPAAIYQRWEREWKPHQDALDKQAADERRAIKEAQEKEKAVKKAAIREKYEREMAEKKRVETERREQKRKQAEFAAPELSAEARRELMKRASAVPHVFMHNIISRVGLIIAIIGFFVFWDMAFIGIGIWALFGILHLVARSNAYVELAREQNTDNGKRKWEQMTKSEQDAFVEWELSKKEDVESVERKD